MRINLLGLALLVAAAPAQPGPPKMLPGVIDIHAHSDPDRGPRSIDAIDLARLAKQRGMRGLVLKNHYESTAALAYAVRKEVPGIEVFGGIDLNRTVGGVNPAAVEHMVLMKGGWGRVIWMPTFDAENQVRYSKENRPFVAVAKDGKLLPEVQQVIALAAKSHLLLETGHSSAEEGLLIVREARRQGVEHVVVTHAMKAPVHMTIPQMQQAAAAGAFILSWIMAGSPDGTRNFTLPTTRRRFEPSARVPVSFRATLGSPAIPCIPTDSPPSSKPLQRRVSRKPTLT
jgi:hypothetical protein